MEEFEYDTLVWKLRQNLKKAEKIGRYVGRQFLRSLNATHVKRYSDH